ncbi:MAG: M3 family metallopeptidase [Myxococcota bacterium]|nr:M3 family metallopeptidase [Myxococcota bacterium]
MRKSLLILALLTACANTPAPVEETLPSNPPSDNPFLTESTLPYGMPRFDLIQDQHYLPAFEAGMQQQLAEIAEISQNPEAATFDNTIVALERSGQVLSRVSATFFNLASAHTNATLQEIEQEIAPKLAAHSDAVYLDAALFARISALHEKRDSLGLDPESLRVLERYYKDFVRAGAQLDDAKKTRLMAINAELAELTTRFGQNLLAETNDSAIIVDTAEELAGLSEGEIASAAEAAKGRGLEGKYLLALRNTTTQPVLARLQKRELRQKVFEASSKRGARDNQNDNRPVIARIVALRAEHAAIFGAANEAAYILEDETARGTEAVNSMLANIAPAALANAKREAAALQALIDAQGGGFSLEPWDWDFYAEQLRKANYDIDESELKPYFELSQVLEKGVFYSAEQLYGLSFKERTDLPVYHPDVRVWEVFDADGKPLSLFFGDFWARESKSGGAWMNEYVMQSGLLGTLPVIGNHLNVPKPPAGEPTLLTLDEVETLFHEFGHALHGMLSDVKYPRFAGTMVPRDFVEFPSQVNEIWTLNPKVLANYAHHYKTGEPIPQALIEKVLAAQQFNQGYITTEYVAAAILDQAWHQLDPAAMPAELDQVCAMEAKLLADAGLDYATVPPRYRSTYFNHVFGGGYAAGYYSYIWAEVLDADAELWFNEHGGLTRENGQRLRDEVLSRGGSVDAMSAYRAFAGREPSVQGLLARRGLQTVDAVQ